MLSSAIAGFASAGIESSGINKDFFYNQNYEPIVQIVVGENGMASDAVAAGNIAAVIGNLAYTTSDIGASGKVTLGVKSKGATGKFEQMSDSMISEEFYNSNEGLKFDEEERKYDKGSFIKYSLACDMSQRETADLLKEPSYNNIHCFFCETLCLSQLENPKHEMSEEVYVNYNKMNIYQDGLNNNDAEKLVLKINSKAISYIVNTGDIPLTSIKYNNEYVDFDWRGKMLLFGEEYHVLDISKDKIQIAKGQEIEITSESFSDEYLGYKFKIEHLIYSAEYIVAGMLIDIEKPDGTVVQTQISKMKNGAVDDVELAGIYAEESGGIATAEVILYDMITSMKLEDGKEIELNGEIKKGWRVYFGDRKSNDSGISEYRETSGDTLKNITIKYTKTAKLESGESLDFPSKFKIEFKGYLDNNYIERPCNDISIEKSENYRATLKFKADNTNIYENIHLDQGPFASGDRFILDGKIYEYTNLNSLDDNKYELILEDILGGGKYTIKFLPKTGSGDEILTTYAFENYENNEEEINLDFDTDQLSTDVHLGEFHGLDLMLEDGDLYVVENRTVSNTYIGIMPKQIGTFDDFYMEGGKTYLYAMKENGTQDLNNDGNTDDVLIIFKNPMNEYTIIDLYDRDHEEDDSRKYWQGISIGDDEPSPTFSYIIRLDRKEDTDLILPAGGTKLSINWDDDLLTESVSICQPEDYVYPTIFVGTSEDMDIAESTITDSDTGKEKTIGCCTYLVKEFEVEQETENIIPKKVVGNLVVSESNVDTNKNLIIVGGPSVNGLSQIIKEEIESADGQFIVKRSGSKIYVAGWEAKDTINAGTALIDWLYENIH